MFKYYKNIRLYCFCLTLLITVNACLNPSGTDQTQHTEKQQQMNNSTLADSDISFEKIGNARDLGGLKASDGRTIVYRKLIRMGNPGLATTKDIQYIKKQINPDVVIDFRTESEKNPAEQTFAESFVWVADPIDAGNLQAVGIEDWLKTANVDSLEHMMIEIYRQFPVRYQAQYKRFLKYAEDDKTIMYHCTAGKDRTGFTTLLLLAALGLDKQTIYDDYLKSNRAINNLQRSMGEQLKDVPIDVETLKPLLGVKASYLQASWDIINSKYGGMDNYLTKILEIDVDKIRANYLQ